MFVSMAVMCVMGCLFLYVYGDGIRTIILRYIVAVAVLGVFALLNRHDIITLVNYVKNHYFRKNR